MKLLKRLICKIKGHDWRYIESLPLDHHRIICKRCNLAVEGGAKYFRRKKIELFGMNTVLMCFLVIGSQFLTSCASKPTETETVLPPVVVKPVERITLYWEDTSAKHPERKPWSDALTAIIRTDLPLYAASKDIHELCPKFKDLNEDGQIKAVSEFWVALAYFESSFNPKANSVDVGTAQDLESYSVGLYQMSGNDGAAKKYGATFKTLQDPIVNIKVATEQMRRQLKNTNEILLPNSSKYRYWAVALENNKYSKIPEIKARVLKYAPECGGK